MGSSATPERPTNPTHFGGAGLYEPQDRRDDRDDASVNAVTAQRSAGAFWEFARRNHVPAVLAVGGFVWLLVSLVRRSTQRW